MCPIKTRVVRSTISHKVEDVRLFLQQLLTMASGEKQFHCNIGIPRRRLSLFTYSCSHSKRAATTGTVCRLILWADDQLRISHVTFWSPFWGCVCVCLSSMITGSTKHRFTGFPCVHLRLFVARQGSCSDGESIFCDVIGMDSFLRCAQASVLYGMRARVRGSLVTG